MTSILSVGYVIVPCMNHDSTFKRVDETGSGDLVSLDNVDIDSSSSISSIGYYLRLGSR